MTNEFDGNPRPGTTDSSAVSAGNVLNVMTIDLEDWYQLTGWVFNKPSDPVPEILERQCVRLLELFQRHDCRATFFCLGKSLADCPHIVKMVADAGHEIATHGWQHERISEVGLASFREDLLRSLDWLDGIVDTPILGHRAPCFSVLADQLDGFFEICAEAGLLYDSSVYPFAGRKYGIENAPFKPYVATTITNGHTLYEMPVGTVDWMGRRWPMAGGGWWRMLPKWLIRNTIRRLNRDGISANIYFHPYEFDSQPLSVKRAVGPSLRASYWTLHQNLGRAPIYDKLDAMLGEFRFGAIEDYLKAHQQTLHADAS